jgi:hypothetical protein
MAEHLWLALAVEPPKSLTQEPSIRILSYYEIVGNIVPGLLTCAPKPVEQTS